MTRCWPFLALLALTACGGDFVPRDKEAHYDPLTGGIVLPYPCPDWSHSSVINYDNSVHSNYGCAVNNNMAQQLAYPEDLAHGRAGAPVGPDAEIGTHVIELYRAGTIPQPLTPMQGGGSSGGGAR
jgi:hypothetical protein